MNIQEFDYSVNLLQALLWQHNKAARLQAILQAKQDWYNENQEAFWQNWYADVFDMTTANAFGLSVWSKILGIPLVVTPAADAVDKPIWGFGVNNQNYGNGNFASSSRGAGLTIEQQRIVLRLRYFQLVTRGAVPEINAFLANVFGPGFVYVTDGLNMACRYVFASTPDSGLQFILTQYDILPRPAGVGVSIVVSTDPVPFGFGENHANYTNGNFHV